MPLTIDINSPEFAKQLISVMRDVARQEARAEIANIKFERVGKVATSGSGATISVYIENSTTAVDIKNPNGLSLTAGQLVVITFPRFKNDNAKYINRLL